MDADATFRIIFAAERPDILKLTADR